MDCQANAAPEGVRPRIAAPGRPSRSSESEGVELGMYIRLWLVDSRQASGRGCEEARAASLDLLGAAL